MAFVAKLQALLEDTKVGDESPEEAEFRAMVAHLVQSYQRAMAPVQAPVPEDEPEPRAQRKKK